MTRAATAATVWDRSITTARASPATTWAAPVEAAPAARMSISSRASPNGQLAPGIGFDSGDEQ